MDSDEDDVLFAAALESFEKAAASAGSQRAPRHPMDPPKARPLQPLRVINAGGSSGAAVAVPPACAPPRQPASAASGVRHLFCAGQQQSPLPAANGASGGSYLAGAAGLRFQQAQQQQSQQQHLPAGAAVRAAAAAIVPRHIPGSIPRADGALIEPAFQQQQAQAPTTEQPPAAQPGPGNAQPAAAAAEEAAEAAPQPQPRRKLRQLFDFLVVYDLEATCERDKSKQLTPQEIIELSCVVVDTSSLQLLGPSFQRYVRPDQHPQLTEFCTELTGITQAMVDGGIPLREALLQHDAWLRQQGLLGAGRTFVPVTWRDWDFKIALAMECKWRKLEQPKYLKRWVDLAAVCGKHWGKKGNLRTSVEAAGLAWEGRAHSAIDDACNTARLAVKLMQGGVILGVTGSFAAAGSVGGLDASGRFRQPTLMAAVGGSKGGGNSGGGKKGSGNGKMGPGSGSGKGGGGSGGRQLQEHQAGRKKPRLYGEGGAWSGCCLCGIKAKMRTVKRPGPNNGRQFWSCGKFTMVAGAGCDFFKFLDEVLQQAPGAAAGGAGSGDAGGVGGAGSAAAAAGYRQQEGLA